MADLDDQLRSRCEADPELEVQVVVTLARHAKKTRATDLGVSGLEEIPGLPGILKGRLKGHEVISLSRRPEIKEIMEDFEVSALQ